MKAEKISWMKVVSDKFGNPRYVCHYSDLLTLPEYQQAITDGTFDEAYNVALKRARKVGGKRYRSNEIGGGIVFQTYSLKETEKRLKALFDGAN